MASDLERYSGKRRQGLDTKLSRMSYFQRAAPPASSTATSAVALVATRNIVFFTRTP